MQKDKTEKLHPAENMSQTAIPTKKQPGGKHQPLIKTPSTDGVTNTAQHSGGFNQSKTLMNDLMPSDE